ncbi:MAG: SRPBCC family protein [Gemmataceae bacterium]
MPIFEYTTKLEVPVTQVFEFIIRPRNALLVNPPSPRIDFVEGPERLVLGSRFTVKLYHFGLTRKLVSVVTQFEENVGFTDEQIEGPFRAWAHTHVLMREGEGTLMLDRIEFMSPGGLTGLFLTNGRMARELKWSFRWREERFRQVLHK